MAKYDDSSWHYAGNYPKNLPNENAATHIGMFLTWCIDNDIMSEEQMEDSEEDLLLVKTRLLTGAEFLINNCDEKFTTDDLNEIGNLFATDYYGLPREKSAFSLEYGDYIKDYEELFLNPESCNSFYEVENTWDNYNLLRPILNKRMEEWKVFKDRK